jgi:hypothetical protein
MFILGDDDDRFVLGGDDDGLLFLPGNENGMFAFLTTGSCCRKRETSCMEETMCVRRQTPEAVDSVF